MQEHLTDGQLTDILAAGDTGSLEHLAACPACREEEQRLLLLLAQYKLATRADAERPEGFWQRQRTAIAAGWANLPATQRLCWVGAVAIVVLVAALLIEKTPPVQPVAEADPDHALLVDVERSVRRELPRALEPAALLAQEVSRGAEAKSNP